jgi:hypothetical protein
MSKKKIRTCCLVIDASIARAAGSLESRHPKGVLSRDFLIAVRSVCYRMALSKGIAAEWDRHQSDFAWQWRVSMMNLRKLQPIRADQVEDLREAIGAQSADQNVVAIMLKDAHLIEAALATDLRIASGDDNARAHFGRLAPKLGWLRRVNWVNPALEDENVIEWLEDGAPLRRSRQLKP